MLVKASQQRVQYMAVPGSSSVHCGEALPDW